MGRAREARGEQLAGVRTKVRMVEACDPLPEAPVNTSAASASLTILTHPSTELTAAAGLRKIQLSGVAGAPMDEGARDVQAAEWRAGAADRSDGYARRAMALIGSSREDGRPPLRAGRVLTHDPGRVRPVEHVQAHYQWDELRSGVPGQRGSG